MIYKPMGSNGEPSLPDAMNWEGKMTVPKSWRAPASRCKHPREKGNAQNAPGTTAPCRG